MAKNKNKNKNKNKGFGNKKKAQKFLSKIISDGRVTKKEAKRATKKGISLARIQKARTKSFLPGNPFSLPETETPKPNSRQEALGTYKAPEKPTYSPLLIKGKAQKIFDKTARRRAGAATTATDTAAADTIQTDTNVAPEVNPLRGELDTAISEIEALKDQLNKRPEMPDFGALFQGLADREAEARERNLIAQREQQAAMMEEMAARQMEYERQRQAAFQTSQANTARSGLLPSFMIGGAIRRGGFGTGGFKRRRRFMPATIAQGIGSLMTGGAAASNAINV